MELREGQVIANHALVRKLGGGAFGEVWLVRHVELGTLRAMKIPTDPQYVKQLRQEGRIQAGLLHPNIVQTLELNTGHSPPYFVMEYVEGMNLRQKLKVQGKLPAGEAVSLLMQMLEGLAVAHAQGVLHRDLKPENVLITPRAQVKLTDFGLGQVQAEVERSLLLSGSLMSSEGKSISGTLQYMSPEQQDGAEADAADDLYAAGIIACELLTGQRPGALGVARMLQRAGVDDRFVAFMEKAMEPARAERFHSAVQMLQCLADLRDGDAARPAATPPRRSSGRRLPVELEAVTLDLGGGVTMKLVRMPAGAFLMGSPQGEEGRSDDETQHRVTLSKPFYIGVTQVTQAQWRAVMGNDPSKFKGDDLPVENVSSDDAIAFCRELSAETGKTVHLPTEAQWEYACRAGSTGPYAGTEKLDDMGWYSDNSGGQTHPVATKQPNAWGLYDMHGNVSEWCADGYWPYPSGPCTDPVAPCGGTARVLRGGSWIDDPEFCRSACRDGNELGDRIDDFGFRPCLDLD